MRVPFLFLLFLTDLDKKYRNEMEMDKSNGVSYMEYVYFYIRVSRKWRKSLPNFQVQIQNPKIHELCYVLEYKTGAKGVFVPLIPG